MKELEEKDLRQSGENWYKEKERLKTIIDEKTQQLEKLKKEEETHRDHIDNIRREVRPILFCFGVKIIILFNDRMTS